LTDVFEQQPSDISNDATATNTQSDQPAYDFIGEGKKYASPEAALQSIPHKDSHISKLEQENAEMRAKLEESTKLSDVLSAMKETGENVQPEAQPVSTSTEVPDIAAMVKDVLQQEKEQSMVEGNVKEANKFMMDTFGDKASDVLSKRASELGMTVDGMRELAARSPAAFTTLFPTQAKQEQPTSTQGDVNPQALGNIPQAGQKRYNEILKTDKRAFLSAEVQLAQMKEAMANPEAYFNS